MSRPPLLHGLCFVNTVIIGHAIDPVITLRRITTLEQIKQIPEQLVGFALPATLVNDTSAQIPSSRPILFFVLAGRDYLNLRPFPHPLVARLGQ